MKTVEFANSVDLDKVALNDILGITKLTMLYQGTDRFYLSQEQKGRESCVITKYIWHTSDILPFPL